MAEARKLRVGMIGAGEVAQVIHIPTLQLLDHLYSIVAICDISKKSADHCASKFRIPAATDPEEILTNPEIDVVFVLTSDEFHDLYTVAALQHGKHVFVEKPMTLSIPSAKRIVDAERAANGPSVFVGYMRRYAPSFVNAFKREMATIPKILYARSRDIIGPNSHFVGQSGTFPLRSTDFPPEAGKKRADILDILFKEAFDGQEITPVKQLYCRFLGGLGSHDLSLMREALGGLPESVAGVSVNEPFYSAIFNYRNRDGSPYAVTYETGRDKVGRFDAHLAVYGENKTVSIHYDTAYIKGLPIKVKVDELNESGEAVTREILSSFQDAYTCEFEELYKCLVEGKPIKTSAEDALNDLRLFDMMYKKYDQGQKIPLTNTSYC